MRAAHASQLISKRIADLAYPNVIEVWKWRGTPAGSHDGILCTGESYKSAFKALIREAPAGNSLLKSKAANKA
jgi:hypothetical protein